MRTQRSSTSTNVLAGFPQRLSATHALQMSENRYLPVFPSVRAYLPTRIRHLDSTLTPMALSAGTRLGPYEILAPLGAGGMGEVYRATDTKLKRQVAIKILPPSLAADSDRLARFQREAEVLASLNHPNIAAIYGLEESRRRASRS